MLVLVGIAKLSSRELITSLHSHQQYTRASSFLLFLQKGLVEFFDLCQSKVKESLS